MAQPSQRLRVLPARTAELFRLAFVEELRGRPSAAITEADGFNASAGIALTGRQLSAIEANKTLRRRFAGIMRKVARRAEDRLKWVSKPWRLGVFRSSWTADVEEDAGPSALGSRIVIRNPTPYAGYVHNAGTPRSATIVRLYVPGIVEQMRQELVRELTAGDFAAAVEVAVRAQMVEQITGRRTTRAGLAAAGIAGFGLGVATSGLLSSIGRNVSTLGRRDERAAANRQRRNGGG